MNVHWMSAGFLLVVRRISVRSVEIWPGNGTVKGTVIWDLGKQGIQADELDLPADETDEKTRTPRISTAKRGSDEMDERMS